MQRSEDKELIEYALITVATLLGVALLLSGIGPGLLSLWAALTALVTG